MVKKYVELSTRKTHKQLNCFIVMPFTQASFTDREGVEHTLNEKELTHIYEELFVKAVSRYNKNGISFVNVHRSNAKRGNFVKDIVGKLQDYDLVVADLTGSNPNVFYELGIRHTLKNGTIMITQNRHGLPSDLGSYIGAEYKYYKSAVEFDAYYPEFEKELHSLIDDVLDDGDKTDNPVRDFIGDRVIFRKEERVREIESNIKFMDTLRCRYIDYVFSFLSKINEWRKSENHHQKEDLSILAKILLNKMAITDENINVIEFVELILTSSQLIDNNMIALEEKACNIYDKDRLHRLQSLNLYFTDKNFKKWHILDLFGFYKEAEEAKFYYSTVLFGKDRNHHIAISEEEPIISSFDYFIDGWKKELKELIG